MLLALPAPADDVVIVVAAVCAGTVCAGRHAVCTHARLLTDLCSLASCSGPWHKCGSLGVLMCANDLAALWLRCLAVYVEWPMLRPALITACWLIDERPRDTRHTQARARMRHADRQNTYLKNARDDARVRNTPRDVYRFNVPPFRNGRTVPLVQPSLALRTHCSAAACRHHENQRIVRVAGDVALPWRAAKWFPCRYVGVRPLAQGLPDTPMVRAPQHGVVNGRVGRLGEVVA